MSKTIFCDNSDQGVKSMASKYKFVFQESSSVKIFFYFKKKLRETMRNQTFSFLLDELRNPKDKFGATGESHDAVSGMTFLYDFFCDAS